MNRRTGLGAPFHQGFTLIEIIVVVLVFSILSLMAYGGLSNVLSARQGIESAMHRTADMQRAYIRMRNDFQNLRDRAARDAFGDPEPPIYQNADDELILTRGGWRNPAQSGRSSLERVVYKFEDGILKRGSWPVVDRPQGAEPAELELLRDTEEVRWRFLDAGRNWHEQWPPEAGGRAAANASAEPPIGVEMVLVSDDWGEMTFLFRTPQAGLAPTSSGNANVASTGASLLTDQGMISASAMGLDQGLPAGGVVSGQVPQGTASDDANEDGAAQ